MAPVPFQQTHRVRQSQQKNQNQSSRFNLDILKYKPFYIWDRTEHLKQAIATNQQCCANHIWGLPRKWERECPLHDYQKLIFDTLMTETGSFKDKHLFVLKSTGLGISEMALRLMAWLCVKDDKYRNSQMVIITGPNLSLAVKLIQRLKNIFEPKLGITFDTKETVVELNGCVIEAFPSNHSDSFRSLTNPAFLLLDELDFLRKSEQNEIRFIAERYIAKSNPYIVLVSTPNAPGMICQKIEQEPEDTCIYKRLRLDYTYGLNRIYTVEEIEKAKKSISFAREMDLQYMGLQGNSFHTADIERSIQLGNNYEPDLISPETIKVLGLDPGWGSSEFGICLLEFVDGCIQVKLADEYERPRYEDMTSKILGILQGLNQWSPNQTEVGATKVYIDAANPSFISSLKRAVGEEDDWNYIKEQLDFCKKNNLDAANYQTIIPVSFNPEAKTMLVHAKELMEWEARPLIGINQKFEKLIVALRTCVSDDQGHLEKESTSYHNVLDAWRLALRHFRIKQQETNDKPIMLFSQ